MNTNKTYEQFDMPEQPDTDIFSKLGSDEQEEFVARAKREGLLTPAQKTAYKEITGGETAQPPTRAESI